MSTEDPGPRWLTAPPGYRPLGGRRREVQYWQGRLTGRWLCELVNPPDLYDVVGLGETQEAAHDDLVREAMRDAKPSGWPLFERVQG